MLKFCLHFSDHQNNVNSEGVFLVAEGGVSQYACSFPVAPDLQWLLFCS